MPTAVQGGHTLHIDVKETTFHPGHYRFALAASRAALPADPNVYDSKMVLLDPTKGNTTSATATIEMPAVFPVLADDVWDHKVPPTKDWTLDLPIPNMDCADCVLEMEQFMAQHPSNVGIGGFFYHHCADLKITADPSMPLFGSSGPDAGTSPDASSGTAGASGSAGATGGGSAGAGEAGSTGSAGATSGGTAGTTGAAGSTSAEAGTSGGSAGANAGTAGAVAGTAGKSGGGSSSGGCTVAGATTAPSIALAGLILLTGAALMTRRRRATNKTTRS
jgi:MYXO-CTERM domain-containing protein